MRLFFVFLIFAISNSLAGQNAGNYSGSHACALKKSRALMPDLLSSSDYGPTHSFDVLKYTLSLSLYQCYLAPYPSSFSASCKVKFMADSVISQISLHAANFSLIIDSVKLAGQSFVHGSNMITVQLDRTYNPGEIAEVMIYLKNQLQYSENLSEYPCLSAPRASGSG